MPFTISAGHSDANPCTEDLLSTQPIALTVTGTGFQWKVYDEPGCAPDHEVNGGIGTGVFDVRLFHSGEFYYGPGLFTDGTCEFLCHVDDPPAATITLTTDQSEILIHESVDVRAHVNGAPDPPTGGGVSGKWAPSNPRRDCDDPVHSPATDFGITADVTVDGHSAPIGGRLDECGMWAFSFAYGGDGCNLGANTGCVDLVEVFCSLPASPTLTTIAEPDSGYVGDELFDSAQLEHAYRATGTITFTLYSDIHCTSPVHSEIIPVDGNGGYDTMIAYVPSSPGTYHWRAFYSGDVQNDGVSTGCEEEPVIILSRDVSIITTPSGDALVGDAFSDEATINSLVPSPVTGVISFNLVGPDSCTDSVASEDVPIGGDGSYPNTPVVVLMPGVYHWVVEYPGDPNHGPYTSDCHAETFNVTDPDHVYTPTIVTQASPDSVGVGLGGGDVAKLTGGNFPTGTLTFRLYGPGDPTCSGGAIYTTTVAVDHYNGFYPCPDFPHFPSVGDYSWTVEYSGDGLNNPVAEQGCDDPGELVTAFTVVPRPMLSEFLKGDAHQVFAKPIT